MHKRKDEIPPTATSTHFIDTLYSERQVRRLIKKLLKNGYTNVSAKKCEEPGMWYGSWTVMGDKYFKKGA